MRLEHLYRLRFSYAEAWEVATGGATRQRFGLAEGRCEGRIAGRFRGANHARVRTDGVVVPDFCALEGEVRARSDRSDVDLVVDVYELRLDPAR